MYKVLAILEDGRILAVIHYTKAEADAAVGILSYLHPGAVIQSDYLEVRQ